MQIGMAGQLQGHMIRRLTVWGQGLHRWCAAHEQYCLLATVGVLWCYIFQEYFLFDRLFLFESMAKDTLSQFYPIKYFHINKLKEFDIPFWSFQFGFGGNVYTEMVNTSPFDLFYLFFHGYDHVEAIPAVFFLKFVCAALFFQAFLRKIGLSSSVSYVGSILYAFSGYMILNAHWYHYLDYAVFSALFLYFFEKWYQDGSWLPLVILIGLVSLKKEIQLIQLAFFGFFYVLFRCVNTGRSNCDVLKVYFRLSLLFLAGIIVWSYYLFPDLYGYMTSSRVQEVSRGASFFEILASLLWSFDIEYTLTTILRTLSPDMLYSWIAYTGPKNYFEASTCFVGIFSFFVFLCSLFMRVQKYKMLWVFPAVFVLMIFFPENISALNMFVSGSLKYIALYLGFYILFASIVVLDAIKDERDVKMLFRWFLLTLIGIVIFLFFFFQFSAISLSKIDKNIVLYTSSFLLIYILILYIWRKFPFFKYVLYTVIIVEVVFFSRLTIQFAPGALPPFFHERGEYYFNADSVDAIQEIVSGDDGFFRMEKGYKDVYLNDAIVQNFFGTESYLSFASSGVIDFYESFDLSLNSPNITSYRYGLEKGHELQTLLGVKYFICRTDVECSGLQGFSLLRTVDDLRIYQNDAVPAFARVLYQQISLSDFKALPLEEKRALILDTAVSPSLLPGIPVYDGTSRAERTGTGTPPVDAFRLQSWDQQHFSGTLSLEQPGILFFPLPFDPGWRVAVNGGPRPLLQLDLGFSGILLEEPGEYALRLHYVPPFMWLGLGVSFLSLLVLLGLRVRYPRFPAC